MVPPSVQQFILSLLQSTIGTSIRAIRFISIRGGSINQSFQVTANTGQRFFAKINLLGELPGLFLHEKEGLTSLADLRIFRIPAVIGQGEAGAHQVLVLEWVETGIKTPKFWKRLGEQLALMHSKPTDISISPGYFGLGYR
ncbi:fructosamine kinase family protein [Paraflavitalea pollutisoli]|uniref:fructosamine kinase family protein n=1 Tax=Paraflavitalea pollutisoli TaxID=3034143 RepID=UPI0023ECE51D|nr:fructosamine kinase family protein [Paraflavitalea sp. H1-2-19X]